MKKALLPTIILILFSGVLQASIEIDAFNVEDSQVVPVFIGGWGSCDSLRPKKEKKLFGNKTPHKMFLYEQAVQYVKTINKYSKKGIEKFVLVCANKGSQNGFFALGSIRTLTYKVKNQEIIVPEKGSALVNLDSHQDNTYRSLIRHLPIIRDNRDHLTTRLLKIANGKPIILFGHSYGAWIAKRIIEILAAPEVYKHSEIKRDRKLFNETITEFENIDSFPIHSFFSLEGISAVSCRITKSIKAGIQNTAGKDSHLGCRQELKSFHEELNFNDTDTPRSLTMTQSALRLQNWYNILLEGSNLPTRAGISTVAQIENTHLDIKPYGTPEQYAKSQAHPFKNAHHMLGFQTKTWNKICMLTFQDNPNICDAVKDMNNKGRKKQFQNSKVK